MFTVLSLWMLAVAPLPGAGTGVGEAEATAMVMARATAKAVVSALVLATGLGPEKESVTHKARIYLLALVLERAAEAVMFLGGTAAWAPPAERVAVTTG